MRAGNLYPLLALALCSAVWGCDGAIRVSIDSVDGGAADLGQADLGVDGGPREDMGVLPTCAAPEVPGGGTTCLSNSAPTSAGFCAGNFCDARPCDVVAGFTSDATCGSLSEFERICDASLTVQITTCAQDNAFAPDPREATRVCMRDLLDASILRDGCLDCVLDAAVCARTFCALTCLGSDVAACDTCRETNGCNDSFYACAGYPNPFATP